MTKTQKIIGVILIILVLAESFILGYLYVNCCGVKSKLTELETRIENIENKVRFYDLELR